MHCKLLWIKASAKWTTPISRTTTNGLFGLQHFFPVFVISQSGPLKYHSNKSRLLKFEWLTGRGNAWLSTARFKMRVFFISLYFWWKPTVFRKFWISFYFLLHVMPDKAAFVSEALLCVQRYQGNRDLYHYDSASRWQGINLHIYAATNSVSLWDYGINQFNCITVSLQFVLKY